MVCLHDATIASIGRARSIDRGDWSRERSPRRSPRVSIVLNATVLDWMMI